MIGTWLVGGIGYGTALLLIAAAVRSWHWARYEDSRPANFTQRECVYALYAAMILAFIAAELTFLATGL